MKINEFHFVHSYHIVRIYIRINMKYDISTQGIDIPYDTYLPQHNQFRPQVGMYFFSLALYKLSLPKTAPVGACSQCVLIGVAFGRPCCIMLFTIVDYTELLGLPKTTLVRACIPACTQRGHFWKTSLCIMYKV